jgi:hypothetical protein
LPEPKKAEVAPSGYPVEFEDLWHEYPTRNGGNPKTTAFRAWNARCEQGHSPGEMLAGVQRYAAWCEATGKLNTEFVKLASTFLGPDKGFSEPWAMPAIQPPTNSRRETRVEHSQRMSAQLMANCARADAAALTNEDGAGGRLFEGVFHVQH